MTQTEIFQLIQEERVRQDKIHPSFPPFKADRLAILGEEFGEVCMAINDNSNLEEELIQVAAVCVRWLEKMRGN
jgi:NTP pyrophosphatase (non-canonical NTP hydrolase)